MAKVITVSRFFPSYHPKKGEPTYFVEKFWKSINCFVPKLGTIKGLEKEVENYRFGLGSSYIDGKYYAPIDFEPKHHTIRKGKRWKTGDIASIRVWGNDINPKSGRSGAYHSKQIIICPEVEVTVYDFEIETKVMQNVNKGDVYVFIKIEGKHFWCNAEQPKNNNFEIIAKNDGLSLPDLKDWFNYPKPFSGQIICWNNKIKY